MGKYYTVGIIKSDQPEKGTTCVAEFYGKDAVEAARIYVGRNNRYAAIKYLHENSGGIIVVSGKASTYGAIRSWIFDVDYYDEKLHLVHPYYPV